jgi:signal transduction histidine kinase
VKPIIDVALVDQEKTHLKIAIRDNGVGFEQKDAEKIFDVFQRLHGRSSKFEGTGIGLASCRKIVEQHDGVIRAESVPGKGSTFFVTLPMDGPLI